jgi:hypothetical protein
VEYDRSKTDFVDHPTDIWLITNEGDAVEAHSTAQGAEAAIDIRLRPRLGRECALKTQQLVLHRPSLRAVYGGPTLIEALWAEMDAIMDRLMTGQIQQDNCKLGDCNGPRGGTCDHEDNGDRYRAEELAWVLAIVTNAYDPSVDRIRAEAMQRWKAAEAEAAAQEEALDPDQEDTATRPEGADQ